MRTKKRSHYCDTRDIFNYFLKRLFFWHAKKCQKGGGNVFSQKKKKVRRNRIPRQKIPIRRTQGRAGGGSSALTTIFQTISVLRNIKIP